MLVLLLLLSCGPVQAEPGNTGWVRDPVNVLDPASRAQLEQLLETVHQQTSAEVMVITVPSLEGMDIDTYATRLFNQIAIGNREHNNGVLFLIAPLDRRMRIEVGYGLEALLTDSRAGEILDTQVIPPFRNNDMRGGIMAGTRAIADLLLRYPDAARGVSGSAPWYTRSRQGDFNLALGLVGLCALGLLGLYFVIRGKKRFPALLLYGMLGLAAGSVVLAVLAYRALGAGGPPPLSAILAGLGMLGSLFINQRLFRRYGPHRCESCSGPMRLLSEQDDDTHLTSVQQLEEKLGSVDYDVWYCPACLKTDTERYVAMFSAFKTCPKCHARTLKETRTVMVAATRSHGGKERYDGLCHSCSHKTSRIEHTARISSSSGSGSSGSGGGSSRGGGSSGGGGASRGW